MWTTGGPDEESGGGGARGAGSGAGLTSRGVAFGHPSPPSEASSESAVCPSDGLLNLRCSLTPRRPVPGSNEPCANHTSLCRVGTGTGVLGGRLEKREINQGMCSMAQPVPFPIWNSESARLSDVWRGSLT